MSMSRKDFEAIARDFRDSLAVDPEDRLALQALAWSLCITFSDSNERFDSQRFLAACGF